MFAKKRIMCNALCATFCNAADFIVAIDPNFRSIVRFRTINVTKVLQNLNIASKVLFSGVF